MAMPTFLRPLSIAMAFGAALVSAQVAAANGGDLFGKHCVACHQADGEGIPGLAPPLVGALKKVAEVDQGRTYIAHVLVSGMAGTIKTRVGNFTGVMPSQAALSDQELAAIASYVLATFNDSPVALKPEGFAALRGKPLPPGEVRKLREQVLAQVGGQ
jgi:mono/diheme cytochrome c family protein